MVSSEGAVRVDEPEWDWEEMRRTCTREARRLLRCPHEVEDAVQEAMCRAWRGRSGCRDLDASRSWVRRIARNEALRLIERRRVTHLWPDEDPAGGEDSHARVLDRVFIDEILDLLPPRDRPLLAMRYVFDMTQVEMAESLGIPEATVRVRLHRIRARLRAAAPELGA